MGGDRDKTCIKGMGNGGSSVLTTQPPKCNTHGKGSYQRGDRFASKGWGKPHQTLSHIKIERLQTFHILTHPANSDNAKCGVN